MLHKIPGIEPAQLQNIKDQTAKQIVRGFKGIRVTDKEEEKQKREWFKPGSREEAIAIIDQANKEMEKAGYPLRFGLVRIEGKWLVEVRNLADNKVLCFISLTEVGGILGRARKKQGFLVDRRV